MSYYETEEFKQCLYSMVSHAMAEVYKKHDTFLDMGALITPNTKESE